MKIVVHDFYTEAFPTVDEVKELCRPGEGANTCSWLVCGMNGFECLYYNKPIYLVNRRENGTMSALRDGCDKTRNFEPFENPGVHEISNLS